MIRTYVRDVQIHKGIVAGVVSSILFLVLLQPILRLVWGLILVLSGSAWTGTVDAIYQSAALGHRNDLSVMFLAMITAAIAGFSGGLLSRHMRRLTRKNMGDAEGRTPRLRRLRRHLTFSSIVSLLATLFLLTVKFADLQVTTSFEQRLTVLAPHLTDLEEEVFRASWAAMQNRGDYLQILSDMEAAAARAGVILPDPLLR